jgi:hypothetical protein
VCKLNFNEDDPSDCDVGSELECPHCGASLVVDEVEMVMWWRVVTAEEYRRML